MSSGNRLRKAFLVTAIVAMSMSLSGCVWATQIYWPSGDPNIPVTTLTVKRAVSGSVVNGCASSHPGDSRGRALCALDAVARLCATQDVLIGVRDVPIQRLDPRWCHTYADHTTDNITAMQTATRDVLNGSGVCLGYGYSSPWYSVKDDEVGVAFGCN
jgi:hypothetical protein